MKTTLLLLCLLVSGSLWAQDSLTIHLDEDVNRALAIVSPAGDGHLCLVLKGGQYINYYLLDSNRHVLHSFREEGYKQSNLFIADRSRAMEVTYQDGVFHYFFEVATEGKPVTLMTKTIDFNDQSTEERLTLQVATENGIMGYFFNQDNQPYAVTLTPSDMDLTQTVPSHIYDHPHLVFFYMGPDGLQRSDSVDISFIKHPDRHFGFVHYVSDDMPQELSIQAGRTLAFVRGHQLLLISRLDDEPLFLALIDLTTFQSKFLELDDGFTAVAPNAKYTQACTLADGHLFVLRARPDSAEVVVFGIPSLKPEQRLSINAHDIPRFIREPSRYGTGWTTWKSGEKEYPVSDWLHDLYSEPAALVVNKVGGAYVLTMGTYSDRRERYDIYGRPDYYTNLNGNAGLGQGDVRNYVQSTDIFGDPGTYLGVPSNTKGHSPYKKTFVVKPLTFRASFARIALSRDSLTPTPAIDDPQAEARLFERLSLAPLPTETKRPAGCVFRQGERVFSGAYDKTTGQYTLREIIKN